MKCLLKYCLLLCVATISISGFAQKISIKGKVMASANNTALAGAQVFLTPGTYGSVTNKKGEYHINKVKKGVYNLTVIYFGFKPLTRTIEIDSIDLQLNFSLDSAVIELSGVTITP